MVTRRISIARVKSDTSPVRHTYIHAHLRCHQIRHYLIIQSISTSQGGKTPSIRSHFRCDRDQRRLFSSLSMTIHRTHDGYPSVMRMSSLDGCVFMRCSGFRWPLATRTFFGVYSVSVFLFFVMFIFDDDDDDSFKKDAQCLPETIMSERWTHWRECISSS